MYECTWTFLRSIIFGCFGVWPKMTQFSESRLLLLVCLVLLPSGHTITTSDILNMTEHGLHPGCVPGTYQAILISRAPTHINAHNCAQNYPQKSAKRPQKPANARKSKNLVNLYNFGSAQLNRNQLGCADWKQNTGEKTGRRAMPMGNTAMTYHA